MRPLAGTPRLARENILPRFILRPRQSSQQRDISTPRTNGTGIHKRGNRPREAAGSSDNSHDSPSSSDTPRHSLRQTIEPSRQTNAAMCLEFSSYAPRVDVWCWMFDCWSACHRSTIKHQTSNIILPRRPQQAAATPVLLPVIWPFLLVSSCR